MMIWRLGMIRLLINLVVLAIFLLFVRWMTNGNIEEMVLYIGCVALFELNMLRDEIGDLKKNTKKNDWNDYV
jgi:hypothetical protein